MKITLHTILELKQVIGQKQIEIELPDGLIMESFLAYMKHRWGEQIAPHLIDPASGGFHSHLRVMVNGQTIQFLQGMKTVLKEGDEVLILPLISGG
jgi:molybdopterin converting factor small subunit